MTQREALSILKTGHNVFLTGAAGSGKTYLLNEFIRFLRDRKINVGITASTGIAATHMGGFTIHSWAGIGIKRYLSDEEIKIIATNKRVHKRFQRTEVLIIDEISMLDADRLDLVDRVARLARGSFDPFGGIQVVLCGDFFQLPPVAKMGEPRPHFAYHAGVWNTMNLCVCYLHEQYRQGDAESLDVLNSIRGACVSDTTRERLHERKGATLGSGRVTRLYSHNAEVDQENTRELALLKEEERYYYMETEGVPPLVDMLKRGCLAPEVLTLKKGAAVMFVKNNFEEGYVNGTLGKITDFDEYGAPRVTAFDGRKYTVLPATWSVDDNGKMLAQIKQIPLRLAWAITIHKSQGMTLDAAEIDLSGAFEEGMGYVALSRVRALAGIKLLGFNDIALRVSPEILLFDQNLQSLSKQALDDFRRGNLAPKKKQAKEENPKTYVVKDVRQDHPAAYQKWSPEEEQIMVADFKGKMAVKTIAEKLGRNKGAIYSRLKKLGLIAGEDILYANMKKEFTIKSRGLYQKNDEKPFKVSRSGIELFQECARCFYLNNVKGIRRPSGPPFNINKAVDTLLKKEFDFHRRGKTSHPLMEQYGIDAVPYQHEKMDEWRENFKGVQYLHEPTNLLVTGAVDDIWENKKGDLIVVDYKATAKNGEINLDAEWQMGYKRQLEVYQWLLRGLDFSVSDTGYFVYCNGRTDREAFDGKVEFDVVVLPYTGSDKWIAGTLHELKKCLESEEMPEVGDECEFCGYANARKNF